MVKLNKIYTKTGDGGTTGLVGGARRAKSDLRIEAYGTIDEANAAIGVARLHLSHLAEADACLARVQNELFDLGADLATPDPNLEGALRIVDAQVAHLEADIDLFNAPLAPLTSFVLPGGRPAAAYLHLARVICRRAERIMVALNAQPDESVGAPCLKYVNRLSDLLFVLARLANDNGKEDALWIPGGTR